MPTVERIVRAGCPFAQIWARLSDYQEAPRWDPRLESVERIEGEGGLGTVYRTRSRVAGVATDGVLRVTSYRRHELLELRGAHAKLRAIETLKLVRGHHGAFVHWSSQLEAPLDDVAALSGHVPGAVSGHVSGAVSGHVSGAVSGHVSERVGDALVAGLAAYLSD